MKKHVKLIISVLAVLMITVSCKDTPSTSTPSSEISTSIQEELLAPANVAYENRIVTWDLVEGATSYAVLINNADSFEVSTNEFTLPNNYFGPVSIAVKAQSALLESPFSTTLNTVAILHLLAPVNLIQQGNIVVWDQVTHATGYIVNLNGSEFYTLENEYNVGVITQSNVLKVMATGSSDGYIVASPYSEPLTIKLTLQNPQNVVVEDDTVKWSTVTNAISYEVIINDEDPVSVLTNQYELDYRLVGEVTIKIKAVSDNSNYLDSAWSTLVVMLDVRTLSTPQSLNLVEETLTFDVVKGADSYQIFVDGELFDEISTNSIVLPNEILEKEGSYLQVKAVSTVHNASTLSAKVYLGSKLIQTEEDLQMIEAFGAYTLANDIVLTTPWVPKPFAGYFDGAGFTISAIIITDNQSSEQTLGFFTTLNQAIVRNLNLSGELDVISTALHPQIGGLAGTSAHTTIENVSVSIDLQLHATNGVAKVGGLIGQISDTTINKAFYDGEILSQNAITGGLIGLATQSESARLIYQSATSGSVESRGGEQHPTGGFIGQALDNYLTIEQSKVAMDVVGPNYVGGFVGYMGLLTIKHSYVVGTISATSTSLVHLGGFAGRVEGYNNKIIFSFVSGPVNAPAGDNMFVGSFVGVTPGGTLANIYENCYYDNTASTKDRIGNSSYGRGDGIIGVAKTSFQTLPFDTNIWSLVAEIPTLQWESN